MGLLHIHFKVPCLSMNLCAAASQILGASEVSANLYCISRTSVLGRLRDYSRLLMGRTLEGNPHKGCIEIITLGLNIESGASPGFRLG